MTDLNGSYTPVIGGLVSCDRCGALLLDKEAERDQHDRFHDGLRKLWRQQRDQQGRPGGDRR